MRILFLMAMFVALAQTGTAKPLVTSSEDTLASVCIDFDDTYERLVDICTQALAQAEDTAEASKSQQIKMLDTLGTVLMNLGRWDEAETQFRRIAALDSTATTGLNGLGWVFWNQGDYETAASYFQTSVNILASYENLAGLAANQIETGAVTMEQGLLMLDAALAINPDYSWAIREKGWRYIEIGSFEQAEAAFEQALALYPEDLNALRGLIELHDKTNRYTAALPVIDRAMQIAPEDGWFLSQRSLAHYYLGNNNQAVRDADRLLVEYPASPVYPVRKARPLVALGRAAEAIALLAQAQQDQNYPSFLNYWQASILADEGELDAALTEIERNTSSPDPSGYDYELSAYILLQRGDTEAAREAIDLGLQQTRSLHYLNYYDVEVEARRGNYEAALERFDQLIQDGLPSHFVGYLAQALTEKGNYVLAIGLRAKYALLE